MISPIADARLAPVHGQLVPMAIPLGAPRQQSGAAPPAPVPSTPHTAPSHLVTSTPVTDPQPGKPNQDNLATQVGVSSGVVVKFSVNSKKHVSVVLHLSCALFHVLGALKIIQTVYRLVFKNVTKLEQFFLARSG